MFLLYFSLWNYILHFYFSTVIAVNFDISRHDWFNNNFSCGDRDQLHTKNDALQLVVPLKLTQSLTLTCKLCRSQMKWLRGGGQIKSIEMRCIKVILIQLHTNHPLINTQGCSSTDIITNLNKLYIMIMLETS